MKISYKHLKNREKVEGILRVPENLKETMDCFKGVFSESLFLIFYISFDHTAPKRRNL